MSKCIPEHGTDYMDEIDKVARQAVTGLIFDPQTEPIIFTEDQEKIKRVADAIRSQVKKETEELIDILKRYRYHNDPSISGSAYHAIRKYKQKYKEREKVMQATLGPRIENLIKDQVKKETAELVEALEQITSFTFPQCNVCHEPTADRMIGIAKQALQRFKERYGE